MARQQQQQPSSMLVDMRTSFNIAVFVADIHTACIRPLTRIGGGPHALGAPGLWAMLLIPVYAGLAESPDLIAYWYVWMAMVVYRRLTAAKDEHTEYQGRPWLFAWCMNKELDMRLMEAGTMPLLGGILCGFSEDVGYFYAAGLFSFGFRYVIDCATVERRKAAARNARIEMEAMQAYFEEEGWRHR